MVLYLYSLIKTMSMNNKLSIYFYIKINQKNKMNKCLTFCSFVRITQQACWVIWAARSQQSAFCAGRQGLMHRTSGYASDRFIILQSLSSTTHCYTWPDAMADPSADTLTHLAVCLERMTSQLGHGLVFQEWKVSFCVDKRHSGVTQRNGTHS